MPCYASPALCGVPVVLDGVVGPSREDLGDLGPLVAVHAVGAHEDVLLRLRPRVLLDRWVQLVVPSGTRTKNEPCTHVHSEHMAEEVKIVARNSTLVQILIFVAAYACTFFRHHCCCALDRPQRHTHT